MTWKQFTHLGNFPPELKARFNSFLTTEFDDSLSVEMQLRSIIKWCQGNFKTVDTLIDFINELSNWLKQFENNFDTKLEDSVISVLSEWQVNGKLDVVISEALQWELDNYISTNEQDKLSITTQLQQTEQSLNAQLALTTEKITKRLNRFSDIELKMVSMTASPRADAQVNGATEYNIRHLLKQGADATMVVLVNVATETSSQLEPMDDNMFLEQIEDCVKAGLKIKMLKPHLVRGWSDAFDRSEYFPDDVETFFNNWKTTMLDYAKICNDYNIEWLCIGCEMALLTEGNYAHKWIALTNDIKAIYPNLKITYACQGDTEWKFRNSFKFVEGMDAVGLNTYLHYTTRRVSSGKITQEDVNQRIYWQPYQQGREEEFLNPYDRYTEIFEETRLPIIITEVGSMPIDEGLISSQPVNQTFNELTYKGQAMQMEAVFGELCRNPHVIGVSWWHVGYPFNYFNDDTTTEAEETLRRYYKEVF